jgi:hypothetical protein
MKKARDISSRETLPLRSIYLEDFLGRLHLLHADRTLQQLPHPPPSAPSPLCDTKKNGVVNLHWFQYGSRTSIVGQCGSGTRSGSGVRNLGFDDQKFKKKI